MASSTSMRSLIRHYERGTLTDWLAIDVIIRSVACGDVAGVLAQLPGPLIDLIHGQLDTYATTDEEWEQRIFISGGSGRCGPDYDPVAEQARQRALYRAGVEALRRYFAARSGE
jgi:hypothetical protein